MYYKLNFGINQNTIFNYAIHYVSLHCVMIYPTQERNRNTNSFISESTSANDLQVIPESNSQNNFVQQILLQVRFQIVYNHKLLNKIDNQAVVN